MTTSQLISLLILTAAASVMLYALLSFLHVRISDSDMGELEQLRIQGVLPSGVRLEDDYAVIQERLSAIAPTVYLRQDVWIAIYFQLLRLARWTESLHDGTRSRAMEIEMQRLCSYQARQYRMAMERLEAFKNPAL